MIDIQKKMKQINVCLLESQLDELIPSKFKTSTNLKKTGISGIFAASLELTREGVISIMQKKPFERLLIKEKK